MEQLRDAVQARAVQPEVWRQTKPFLVAIPCVLALATCLMGVVAWKLYDEFAWTIYKHISADLRMKRRYLAFQIYIALLKFDFFFFLGFTVQFVVIVQNNSAEFILTIVAIPATILILLMAAWFVRRETLIGVVGILVCPAAFAYNLPANYPLVPLFRWSRLFRIQALAHVLNFSTCS